MREYYLSYFNGNEYRTIDLTNVDVMKNKNAHELCSIDAFTMNFNTTQELKTYLKEKRLIPGYIISDLCITSSRVNKNGIKIQAPIYNGNEILLSNNIGISLEFARKTLEEHKTSPKFMLLLAENYKEKYKNSKGEITFVDSQIVAVFEGIIKIAYIMAEVGYGNLDPKVKDEYNALLSDLETIIFYRYAVEYDEDIGDVVFRRAFSNGNGLAINYKGLRNFTINASNILKTVFFNANDNSKTDIRYTDDDDDFEHEEFLYRSDYKVVNDEILDTYNPSETELSSEMDGHDYNRMLTRKELSSALNTYATKALRRRPREDGGAL